MRHISRLLLLWVLVSPCSIAAVAQSADTVVTFIAGGQGMRTNPYFPFIVSNPTIEYDITVNLKDPRVINEYAGLFKHHNLPYNSDTWEDIVTDLLRNYNIELARQIITSAQDGVLRIGTGNVTNQQAFLKYMVPIFSSRNALEHYL